VDQALRRQQVGSQKPADRQVAGRRAGRQAGSGQRGDSRGQQKKKKKVWGKGALKALSEEGTRRNWTHYELCSTRRNTAKRGGAQISSARTRNHSAHAQALVSLAARPVHDGGIDSFMKIRNLIEKILYKKAEVV
jgi:hypothetical protein